MPRYNLKRGLLTAWLASSVMIDGPGVAAAPLSTTTIDVHGTSLPVFVINQIIDGQCSSDQDPTAPAAPQANESPTAGPGSGGTQSSPSFVSSSAGSSGSSSVNSVGNFSGTSSGPPPSSTVLAPATHPGVDTSDVSNLVPSTQQQFYHSEVGQGNGTVAIVDVPQMNYPTVQLLQSDYITNVQCTATDAVITFNNKNAFDTAVSKWSKNEQTLLIAYHAECGNSSTSLQNEYIVINGLTSDDSALTIDLKISIINFVDAVNKQTNVTVTVGSYSPTGNGSFNATGGSGGTGSSSGTGGTGPGNSTGPSLRNGTSDFDALLDAKIGTGSLEDASLQAQFFPDTKGITLAELEAGADDAVPTRRTRKRKVHRAFRAPRKVQRRWGWPDWVSDIADDIYDAGAGLIDTAAQAVAETVSEYVGDAVALVESAAEAALDQLDSWTSIDQSLSETVGLNEYPGKDSTPWGAGITLFNSEQLSAYCVGCGANGQLSISGTITFSLAKGISAGNIGANGELHGTILLGIQASIDQTFTFPTVTVAEFTLSDLVLPGILEVGPQVKLDVGGNVEVTAHGELLAGVSLDWNDVSATLDVVGDGSGASGWAPEVSPRFEASGQVGVSAETFLDISLGITIGILENTFSLYVDLVDTPGIHLSAGFAGEASFANGELSASSTSDCSGVEFGGYVYNNLNLDLSGYKQVNLLEWKSPELNQCVSFSKIKRQELNIAAAADNSSSVYNNSSDTAIDFNVLSSSDGTLDLHWAEDGNIYVIAANDTSDPTGEDTSDISSQFVATGDSILGDYSGRILHGYVDTLDEFGVSRLRFSSADSVPTTAISVALVPVTDVESGADLIVASTSAADIMVLITCVYEDSVGLYPKIFLAKDPVEGVTILESEAVAATVTGGNISSCGLIGYTNGATDNPDGSTKKSKRSRKM